MPVLLVLVLVLVLVLTCWPHCARTAPASASGPLAGCEHRRHGSLSAADRRPFASLSCRSDDKHPVFDILKANFDAAYGANRAPMPVFVHTPWLLKYKDQLAKFIGEVWTQEDCSCAGACCATPPAVSYANLDSSFAIAVVC
jgi:hypothetical protein